MREKEKGKKVGEPTAERIEWRASENVQEVERIRPARSSDPLGTRFTMVLLLRA